MGCVGLFLECEKFGHKSLEAHNLEEVGAAHRGRYYWWYVLWKIENSIGKWWEFLRAFVDKEEEAAEVRERQRQKQMVLETSVQDSEKKRCKKGVGDCEGRKSGADPARNNAKDRDEFKEWLAEAKADREEAKAKRECLFGQTPNRCGEAQRLRDGKLKDVKKEGGKEWHATIALLRCDARGHAIAQGMMTALTTTAANVDGGVRGNHYRKKSTTWRMEKTRELDSLRRLVCESVGCGAGFDDSLKNQVSRSVVPAKSRVAARPLGVMVASLQVGEKVRGREKEGSSGGCSVSY